MGYAGLYGMLLHDVHIAGCCHTSQSEMCTKMKDLDPLLHSQLRLAVMSVLMAVEEADFVYLKDKTGATAGNLSVQLDKLSSAGYIEIEKGFVGKKTRTICRVTTKGRSAFETYVNALRTYINI